MPESLLLEGNPYSSGLTSQQTFKNAWKQRLHAVRNFPPVLRMVWASGPRVVAASLLFRVIASLIPIAMLAVSRLIIDDVVASSAGRRRCLTYSGG